MSAETYSGHPLNFSVFALFGAAVALVAVTVALLMAWRARDFDTGFWIVVVSSSVVSPVAWIHYFLTFLPALYLLLSRNIRRPLMMLPVALLAELVSFDVPIYHLLGVRWIPLVFVLALTVSLYFLKNERKTVATIS